MNNIRQKAIDEIEKRYNENMDRINTPLKLVEYLSNHQSKYKNPEKSLPKHFKRIADKEKNAINLKIDEMENAKDFSGEFIITVEWKKSHMWGSNPKAYTNAGYESSSIGGCKYDKLSTATAEALNSNKSILKLLYEKKNANIDKSNHELLGYGSGYGILPQFEGGVGVSSHIRIIEGIGLKMQTITSTKNVDVFLITKVWNIMRINDTVLDELKTMDIQDYQIRDIIKSRIRDMFYKHHNIYLDDKTISNEFNDWTTESNINLSVVNLSLKVAKAFESLDNAKIFYELEHYQYVLREINDKFVEFHRYNHLGNKDILFIVKYAITNTFDKDYAIINKILDEHNPIIKYDNYQWLIALGKNEIDSLNDKVTIKSFKNGKITIAGLTNEQKERIQKGFDIVKKYRNVTV